MIERIEVVIIGAGPSGLGTALHLIRRDPTWAERLIVLEKRSHPRPKLCGGGLTPFAMAQMSRLGLSLDIPYVEVDSARVTFGPREMTITGAPVFVITRRPEFDAWLAAQAKARGVRLLEDTPVQRLRRHPEGILVETASGAWLAQAVVAADGSKGVVRRWLGAHEPRPRVARLLEVITPAQGDEPEFAERAANFDFGALGRGLQGYYWDFPSLIHGAPYMNRGVYDGRVAPERPRADLPQILSEAAAARGVAPEALEIEGHPIHWFAPTNQFSSERVLMVGDAAGADPLLGEGIGVALGYGQVAAAALVEAVGTGRWSFSGYRRRVLLSPVGRYLARRWLVATAIYRISGSHRLMLIVWAGLRLINRIMLSPVPRVEGVLPPRSSFPHSPHTAAG
jgi:flavin-dependent dehydrogenase